MIDGPGLENANVIYAELADVEGIYHREEEITPYSTLSLSPRSSEHQATMSIQKQANSNDAWRIWANHILGSPLRSNTNTAPR